MAKGLVHLHIRSITLLVWPLSCNIKQPGCIAQCGLAGTLQSDGIPASLPAQQ